MPLIDEYLFGLSKIEGTNFWIRDRIHGWDTHPDEDFDTIKYNDEELPKSRDGVYRIKHEKYVIHDDGLITGVYMLPGWPTKWQYAYGKLQGIATGTWSMCKEITRVISSQNNCIAKF